MTIIVEGFDNCGKTTLIKQLMEKFPEDLRMIKPPGPFSSREVLLDWLNPSLESLKNPDPQDKITIFDRYPLISEPIYGPGVRGFSMITEEEILKGLGTLMGSTQPVLLILCCPPSTTVFNFGEREQMEGVIEKSHKLLDRYNKYIRELSEIIYYYNMSNEHNSSLVTFYYDWTVPDSFEWVSALIQNHINQVRVKIGKFEDLSDYEKRGTDFPEE